MADYQDIILTMLSERAEALPLNTYTGDLRRITLSITQRYSNRGRLIAHHPADLSTLATLNYTFDPSLVRMSMNDCHQPGEPKNGPRSDSIFHWTPGNPADDDEIVRLRTAWVSTLRKTIIAGLEPTHAKHYRRHLESIGTDQDI